MEKSILRPWRLPETADAPHPKQEKIDVFPGNHGRDRDLRLPLQGKLDALKAEFETNIAPPAVVEVLHRSIDELIASGAPARALAFSLPDADGALVFSTALLA